MFAASEKEYELLKKETSEIRNCINKYIGYIISIAGLSGFIAKYFFEQEEGVGFYVDCMMLIILGLMLITIFFEVIWYKFKSHNRHVGYMQLLTQEMDHYQLSDLDQNDQKIKKYLDNPPEKKLNSDNYKKQIFGWEFVMSRFNGANLNSELKEVLKATEKAKFIFRLPINYKYELIRGHFSSLDSDFFSKVIHPLYSSENKKNKEIRNQIDARYLTNGWKYPKIITILAFIPVFFISIVQSWLILMSWNQIAYYKSIIFLILTVALIGIWIFRYILKIKQLLRGKGSIDYYCWTFFIYRIQLLNTHDVLPVYFSRGFIRFFKSRNVLKWIEENPPKVEEVFTDKPKKERIVIIENYKKKLKNCQRFTGKERGYHNKLILLMKKE